MLLFVGDLEAAGRLLDFVENYATEHRLTVMRDMATCMRGRWLLDSGRPFELEAFRNALTELYEGGFRMRYPSYLANYSAGLAQHGDTQSARACIDEAIALATSSGHAWGLPEILRMKGNIVRAEDRSGASQAAADCYLQSMALARQHGALSWELRAAASWVELSREAGGNEQAEKLLSSLYARFSEGFATRDLRRARSLLEGT